jgi:acetyl esterase/lipase
MIETIPHNGGLGLKRMMARRMARRTGQAMMFAEDIDVARERLDRVGETAPCAKDVDINQTEIAGVSALSFQRNDPRPGTLIYCHGGGFLWVQPIAIRPLCPGSAKLQK